jgi:hypothetical protein
MYKAYPETISSTDERLEGIIDRLKHGASLISESRALGFTNNVALRETLKKKIGREAFEKLVPANGWKKGSR